MRVAVIGAGPAGFFVAGEVLKKLPGADVSLFEKRIAPYGLVRYGVAPDHPVTRRVIKMFDQIASDPRFTYLGNVNVERDPSLEDLLSTFHAVVVCTGAEHPRRPAVPGSDKGGVYDALEFSRWVNGGGGTFTGNELSHAKSAVVIGNGNVALDVVRMLVRPRDIWSGTDVDARAEEVLTSHELQTVYVLGRRGPADASFTEAEFEELLHIEGWAYASNSGFPFELQPHESASERNVRFLFHTVAGSIRGDKHVEVVQVDEKDAGSREIPADLVFFATGHTAMKLRGFPLDKDTGIAPNEKGRIEAKEGLYASGWIKRGAHGLIGHNRKDAIETVGCIVEDADSLSARNIEEKDWTAELTARGLRVVSWKDWQEISEIEMTRGAGVGRPRVNFTDEEFEEFLQ